jgi:1,4-dihydroxy-2-naphthoate octaprenyltransferase
MEKIRFWLKNARYVALPQSLFPAVLAICMALYYPDFSLVHAFFALVGIAFAHLGMNLFDDYFDYKNQKIDIRDELAENNTFSRIGKCDYLLSKKATTKQLFFVASLFLFIALIMGFIIFLYQGITVLWIALITGFLGIFYSAKPFCLGYRGFGELLIGLIFGPLLMGGVFFASCGEYSPAVCLVSIAVGLLVTNILFTHSILDYHPDKQTGKKTLAVLIRSRKGMFFVSCLLNIIPFLLIGYGIFARYLSFWYGLVFLALPLAIYLIYLIRSFFCTPQKKFFPRFWMLPMENWDKISEAGIDWFMIRWYLARNLTMLFCLLAMIASLILVNNVFL